MAKRRKAKRRSQEGNDIDCRTCGLCCVAPHEQDSFCDMVASNIKRLAEARSQRWVRRNVLFQTPFNLLLRVLPSAALRTKVLVVKSGPLRGHEALTCVALRGTVLKKVSCSIYEHRPRACREAIKPGDRTCREIKWDMGELEAKERGER